MAGNAGRERRWTAAAENAGRELCTRPTVNVSGGSKSWANEGGKGGYSSGSSMNPKAQARKGEGKGEEGKRRGEEGRAETIQRRKENKRRKRRRKRGEGIGDRGEGRREGGEGIRERG